MSPLQRYLLGRPLATAASSHERLSKSRAIGAFGLDALSSVAYGPDEILYVLLLAGSAGVVYDIPIAVAICALLVAVVASYRQTIYAYPSGGGSFTVARENLGPLAGLIAAAALIVDYLTVIAVSVTAGVQAIVAFAPSVHQHVVLASVLAIVALMIINLRGIREAGAVFVVPTYVFIGSLAALLAWGALRIAHGDHLHAGLAVPAASRDITLFLVLRAFAGGCTAMTGIEAIANGVPVFRANESKNAARTLVVLGTILAILFFGVVVVAHHIGAVPGDTNVIAQIGKALGGGPLFYIVQLSTASVLLFAANTSFNGFPLLAAILANDEYAPHQFANRGSRLGYSNGIIVISIAAIALVIAFNGSTHALIPLFAVGVFLCFTLSQAGMVRHWLRERGPNWRAKLLVNGLGALMTAVTTLIVVATKFTSGAWVVVVVVPFLVANFVAIHRHYAKVNDQLAEYGELRPLSSHPPVIVPVKTLNRATIHALDYARSFSDNIVGLHVATDDRRAQELRVHWAERCPEIALTVIDSPFRDTLHPLLQMIESARAQNPNQYVTVIIPEVVPRHWWEEPLHHQTGLSLEFALRYRPDVVVVSLPVRLSR